MNNNLNPHQFGPVPERNTGNVGHHLDMDRVRDYLQEGRMWGSLGWERKKSDGNDLSKWWNR